MTSEAFFIGYLQNSLDLADAGVVSVSSQVPAHRPDRFVTVERTGGRCGLFFDYPTFAVQVWAESEAQAARIAKICAKVVRDAMLLDGVANSRVISCYSFRDAASNTARYQLVVAFQCLNFDQA